MSTYARRRNALYEEIGRAGVHEFERRRPEYNRRFREIEEDEEREGRRADGAIAATVASIFTVGVVGAGALGAFLLWRRGQKKGGGQQ